MPGSSKEEQLSKILLETQNLVKESSVSEKDISRIVQRLDAAITKLSNANTDETPQFSADGLSSEEAQ
jgi:hypothetical protein